MPKTVAVIGLGYVGMPLALLLKSKGYLVKGIDIDPKKINSNNGFEITSDYKVISEAEIIIVCVPTPVFKNKHPDYRPLITACLAIGKNLQRGSLVIIESSVNPGSCEEVAIPSIEKNSNLKCGKDFLLAHCPERINPGDKKWNVSNLPRVVGGFNEASLKAAVKFYKSIISAPITPMNSLSEAEAVKIVENSFRNINIAFVNELAKAFARLNIDVVNVINGAATKPFAFMAHYPSCGVGGHCIPVDPHYLIEYSKKKVSFNHQLLKMASQVNDSMPQFTVEQLLLELEKLDIPTRSAKIAVLGLTYKGDVPDIRESPALEIIHILKKKKLSFRAFDPLVSLPFSSKTLEECILGADAVIIATNHSAFKKITPKLLLLNKVKIIIDGKNYYKKSDFIKAGINYRGIGR